MKNTIIYCKPDPKQNTLSFFAVQDGKEYFIFTRKYKGSLLSRFKNGIPMNKLFDYKKTGGDTCLIHLLDQFRSFLKFVEKEYDIQLLYAESKKQRSRNRERAEKHRENYSDRFGGDAA